MLNTFLHCFESCVESLLLVSWRVFVLSFRWIPSELHYSNKGSRFFDRDYDPSKSLLRVLAQRLTRSSPAWTSDQDCSSPSLMHLDVGKVDFTYHVHVPVESVQSYAPSDELSTCTGHAAAVSHQWFSVTGKSDCIGGFGKQVLHGSFAPLTFLWATSVSGRIAVSG